MPAATPFDEARRWTKFPATLLFVTGLLWLLVVVFYAASNWTDIAQHAETFVGAVVVFILAVVVPLGSPLAGVFILYLHRRALYVGGVLPFFPLLYLTWTKASWIAGKFHEYRTLGKVSSFGAAVIEAFILLGLWCIVWVHVLYVRRALRELAGAEQWSHAPVSGPPPAVRPGVTSVSGSTQPAGTEDYEEDDCFLLPDSGGDDDQD